MTTHFYRLMFIIVATLMSLIGCNGKDDPDPTPVYGPDSSVDLDQYQTDHEHYLYGVVDTDFAEADTVETETLPDEDTDTDADADADIDEVQDVMYGPDAVDFDDSVDNDTDTDSDIIPDEDEPDVQGDEYACPYATFHVDGTVTNANGDPIPGIEVTVDFTQDPMITTTSNDGSFLIETEVYCNFNYDGNAALTFKDIDQQLNDGLHTTKNLGIQLDQSNDTGGWDKGSYEKKGISVTLQKVGESDDDTLLNDDDQ